MSGEIIDARAKFAQKTSRAHESADNETVQHINYEWMHIVLERGAMFIDDGTGDFLFEGLRIPGNHTINIYQAAGGELDTDTEAIYRKLYDGAPYFEAVNKEK